MPCRRALLASLAGVAGATAGCSMPDISTDTRMPTDTPTPTEQPKLRLVPSARGEVFDGPLTVYPLGLREDLLTAARTDGTVRGHGAAPVYKAPEPVVTGFDTVEFVDTDADGRYAVTAKGGTRYELLVGLEQVDPPADATVTDIAALQEPRAEFLQRVRAEHVTVYPETPRGEWVRHTVFGGYFRIDGTVYRGHEVKQTDAKFFSEGVWYTLSLVKSDVESPRTLRFPDVPGAVRRVVDDLLEGLDAEPVTSGPVSASVAAFAASHGPFLDYGVCFRLERV